MTYYLYSMTLGCSIAMCWFTPAEAEAANKRQAAGGLRWMTADELADVE